MKITKNKLIIIFLLTLFFLKVALHLSQPIVPVYEGMGDSYVRIMNVWADNYIPRYGVWLPLHHILIKTFFIYNNLYLSPRILSFIISFFLFNVFFKFTSEIFKHQETAKLATFFLLINSMFSALITIPLTEPLFALLFLSGLYYLLIEKPKIYLAAFLFTFACSVRYEGWFLFPLIFIFAYKRLNKKQLIIFSFIYLLFPLIWLRQNYLYTGNLLYFVKAKFELAQKSKDYQWFDIILSVRNWIEIFIRHVKWYLVPFLLVGIFRFKLKSKLMLAYACSFYLIFTLIFQTYLGSMEWYPQQYVYLPTLLLIPSIALGIREVFYFFVFKFNLNKYSNIIAIIGLAMLLALSLPSDYYFLSVLSAFYPPSISNIIKKYQDKQFIFVYGKNDYPSDRDYIMYFAEHNSYTIETEENIYPYINSKKTIKYPSSFFISSSQKLSYIKTTCEYCKVFYRDSNRFIWRIAEND